MVHPYRRIDNTDWQDFHMIDNLSIAVYAFARYILISLSLDKNSSPSYREPQFRVEMSHFL